MPASSLLLLPPSPSSPSLWHPAPAAAAGASLPVGCRALSDRRRAGGLCQRLLVLLNSHVTEYGIIPPSTASWGVCSLRCSYRVDALSLKHLCRLSLLPAAHCLLRTAPCQAARPRLSHALPLHFGKWRCPGPEPPCRPPRPVSLAGSGAVIYGVPRTPRESSSLRFREIHRTGRGGHRVAGLLTLPTY